MRSSAPKQVTIYKSIGLGDHPMFIPLMHKHLEKEKPPVADPKAYNTFTAPVDLLEPLLPKGILDSIDAVELIYMKKP